MSKKATKKKSRKGIINTVNLIYAVLLIACVIGMIASGAKNNFGNLDTTEDVIWNYLKKEGFTDYSIAGMIGCWTIETHCDPGSIEGDYLPNFPSREKIMKDMNGYCICYLFPYYKRKNLRISRSAYMSHGEYYPGIGIMQLTGPRAYELIHFNRKTKTIDENVYNSDWNSIELQLDFMLHYDRNEEFWENYKKIKPKAGENEEETVKRATEEFFSSYEMPGNHETKYLEPRQESAFNAYKKAVYLVEGEEK
ncbi:MAG: hypothetical protein K6E28_06430 [Eubacterium sp.]|nr:hypothetical protein [Eubacterium sp.]